MSYVALRMGRAMESPRRCRWCCCALYGLRPRCRDDSRGRHIGGADMARGHPWKPDCHPETSGVQCPANLTPHAGPPHLPGLTHSPHPALQVWCPKCRWSSRTCGPCTRCATWCRWPHGGKRRLQGWGSGPEAGELRDRSPIRRPVAASVVRLLTRLSGAGRGKEGLGGGWPRRMREWWG